MLPPLPYQAIDRGSAEGPAEGGVARPSARGAPPAVSLPVLCGNVLPVPTEIERLYREHRAGLVRLVERELHDHHDAEDVVQTAFLDAQRALERGTIPRNPRAWLAAVALNAGRRLRRRRLNAEPLEEYAAQEAPEAPEIRAALATLPREQRAAVVYRDLLGLSYGETAKQMGTSVNAVTMLLHRGRKRLRQALGVTTGGIGSGRRWLRHATASQVAAVKGAAVAVVAAGLATGVVTARVIAPIGATAVVAAPTAHGGSVTKASARTSGRPHRKAPGAAKVNAVPPSTRHFAGVTAPASAGSSRARVTVRMPIVSLPALPIPASPATVTVSTPVTTVAVTTPTVPTAATVTTPILTVTVPIP